MRTPSSDLGALPYYFPMVPYVLNDNETAADEDAAIACSEQRDRNYPLNALTWKLLSTGLLRTAFYQFNSGGAIIVERLRGSGRP